MCIGWSAHHRSDHRLVPRSGYFSWRFAALRVRPAVPFTAPVAPLPRTQIQGLPERQPRDRIVLVQHDHDTRVLPLLSGRTQRLRTGSRAASCPKHSWNVRRIGVSRFGPSRQVLGSGAKPRTTMEGCCPGSVCRDTGQEFVLTIRYRWMESGSHGCGSRRADLFGP